MSRGIHWYNIPSFIVPLFSSISILLSENQKSYPPWETHLIMAIFTPLLLSYYQCYIKWFPVIFATTLISNKKRSSFHFFTVPFAPPSFFSLLGELAYKNFLFQENIKQMKRKPAKKQKKVKSNPRSLIFMNVYSVLFGFYESQQSFWRCFCADFLQPSTFNCFQYRW